MIFFYGVTVHPFHFSSRENSPQFLLDLLSTLPKKLYSCRRTVWASCWYVLTVVTVMAKEFAGNAFSKVIDEWYLAVWAAHDIATVPAAYKG